MNFVAFRRLFLSACAITVTTLLASCTTVAPQQTASGPVSLQANPKHIALMLPLTGPDASAGQAVRDGFLTAYYNTTPSQTSPTVVRVYDTGKGVPISTLYLQAVADKGDIIIGPLEKTDVTALAKIKPALPVLALSAPNELQQLQPGFFEFDLSQTDEAAQVAAKAFADGHRNALIIYLNNPVGINIASSFASHWQQHGGKVAAQLALTPNQNIQQSIATVARQQNFDMVFIVANPSLARQIVPALQANSANNIAMYATSAIYNGIPNPNYYSAMGNVMFCGMPWLLTNSQALQQAQTQMSKNGNNNYLKLYALGTEAFALVDELNTLAASPMSASYAGVTGTLYVNQKQHVLRQLAWAQFNNGQVQTIN